MQGATQSTSSALRVTLSRNVERIRIDLADGTDKMVDFMNSSYIGLDDLGSDEYLPRLGARSPYLYKRLASEQTLRKAIKQIRDRHEMQFLGKVPGGLP